MAQYLDPADFPALQNRTWCPRVHGRESEGCQNVTVVDLLSMTSGILPSDMGACEDVPLSAEWTPDEWYWQYRYRRAMLRVQQVYSADHAITALHQNAVSDSRHEGFSHADSISVQRLAHTASRPSRQSPPGCLTIFSRLRPGRMI